MFEDDSSSSVSALQHPALHSEWIHPADWSFSFRGSRLCSGSYQSSQQLSICQIESITAALLLWCGSVSIRSRSLGLWRRWLLLMFSCHWLAFHRAVSQRLEALYGMRLERDQHKHCQDSSGACTSTGNENCPFDGMESQDEDGSVKTDRVWNQHLTNNFDHELLTCRPTETKLNPNVSLLLSEVKLKQQSDSLWV